MIDVTIERISDLFEPCYFPCYSFVRLCFTRFTDIQYYSISEYGNLVHRFRFDRIRKKK